MTPDDAIYEAVDDALIAEGLILGPDEVESVVDALLRVPPDAWALLERKRNAVVHGGV
jgi:hypothetical protein